MKPRNWVTTTALALAVVAVSVVGGSEVPVFPAPRRSETGTQARAVAAGGLSLELDEICIGECAQVVRAGFERVVIGAIAAQQGLSRWRLSLHNEIDAPAPATPTPGLSAITTVRVKFESTGKTALPELRGMNGEEEEWHEIRVGTTGAAMEVRVKTAWGALRAFETIVQLAEWDEKQGQCVVGRLPLVVEDWPRFPWRGLMVDTARHFLPISKLRQLVDAIAAMKMNVLHLHLTDAQSFPFEVESVPRLSGRGTFNAKAVYTHADMQAFVAHARARGVMVVPEIDIPAHTGSWRFADSDLVADCWDYARTLPKQFFVENILPLNPASPKTWDTIKKVLGEVSATFSSPYLHVGGDEVRLGCWEHSTQVGDIKLWMADNGYTAFSEVEGALDVFAQATAWKTGKRPIVWADAFVSGNIDPSAKPIIQIWIDRSMVTEVVRSGHDTILSAGYYLDMQSPTCGYPHPTCPFTWLFSWTGRNMFLFDPIASLGLTPEEERHVLGGEAPIWSESVDVVNIDAMALSRVAGMAERLWSNTDLRDPDSFEIRAQRHRCLSVRRGISGAGPLAPDICEVRWSFPRLASHSPATLPLHRHTQHQATAASNTRRNLVLINCALGGFLITFIVSVFGPLRKCLLPPTRHIDNKSL